MIRTSARALPQLTICPMVEAAFIFDRVKNIMVRLVFITQFCWQNWKKYTRSQERMVSETQRNFPFKNRETRALLDFSF